MIDLNSVIEDESNDKKDQIKKILKTVKKTLKESNYTINKKGELCILKDKKKLPFCNFIPIPSYKTVIDNGINQYHQLELSCILKGTEELDAINLSISDMQKSLWIDELWNFRCSLYPSVSRVYEHLLVVIKLLSEGIEEKKIYSHIGWTLIDGNYYFLHKGGGIGKIDLNISIDKSLSNFNIKRMKEYSEHTIFVKMMDFLRVATKEVSIPLFSYVTLSLINYFLKEADIEPKFIMWLHGESGSRKTTLAKLFTCFFRSKCDVPTGSFKDTPAAIERLTFEFKDSVVLLDDFHPSTNKSEKDEMNQKAQHFIRVYGDRITKKRMTSNLEKQKELPPRGLMLVTGEDFIGGTSSAARCFSVPIKKEDVNISILSRLQALPDILPTGIYYYLKYLATKMESHKKHLKKRFIEYRTKFSNYNFHGRSSENIAWLLLSFELYLEYGLSINGIDKEEQQKKLLQAEEVFIKLTEDQFIETQSEDPVAMYLLAIKELIASNQAYIEKLGVNSNNKNRIGWEDDHNYYMIPDQTYNTVVCFWKKQNKLFPISSKKLNETLQQKEIIEVAEESTEDNTKTYKRTVKKSVYPNRRLRVLIIKKDKMDQYLK